MQFYRKRIFLVVYLAVVFFIYLLLYRNLNTSNEASSLEEHFNKQESISTSKSDLLSLQRAFIKKFYSNFKFNNSKLLENDEQIRLLVLADNVKEPSFNVRELVIALQGFNLNHNVITLATFLKVITIQLNYKQKKYSAFIFESFELFKSLSFSDSELFQLCSRYQIGILFLKYDYENLIGPIFMGNSSVNVRSINNLTFCELNSVADFWKMTKFNAKENILHRLLIQSNYPSGLSFVSHDQIYESIINCTSDIFPIVKTAHNEMNSHPRRAFIGLDLNHLMLNILFDVLNFVSYGYLSAGDDLKRFIQVDIDDVFVGSNHKRLKQSDVLNLIDFQEAFLNKHFFTNSIVFRFKFNLGYSGYYFKTSVNEDENKADELLLSK
jgi:hypothetical protein